MRRRTLPSVRETNVKSWRSLCENEWAIYALVASVGALTYSNSLNGEFVHDDIPAIVTNGDVTGVNPVLRTLKNDFWGTPMSDPGSHKSYRPLTTLTFRLNFALCGLSAWWWHACNIALHAACCALVARAGAVVARLQRPFAALAALLFAVHPVHSEAGDPKIYFYLLYFGLSVAGDFVFPPSTALYLPTKIILVAGVVGRADVLACVFFLSSVLLYHGSSGRKRVWSSVVLAALSMLAKETGLTALLFNLIFDLYRSWSSMTRSPSKCRWRHDGVWSRVSKGLIFLIMLAVVRLALLQGSLPAFSPQDNPPAFHQSFIIRLMTFCYLAAFNWWLLLCPWTLSHDWQMGSIPLITSGWDPRNLLTGAALVALMALSYRCLMDLELQRHTPLVVGLMLLVIPYLPASNLLVTVGFVVAERVLYIPSVGSVVLTVYGMQVLCGRAPGGGRRALALGVAALVAAGAARTYVRNRDWKTRETLLKADLAVLPHNAKLHYNFANFLKDIEQQENAIKHYKEALKLWPSYASAHNNLGTLVLASGRAEHHFLQALKYNRDHVNAHYNLAKLYRKKNRISESQRMLERCISLDPRFLLAHLELLHITPEKEKKPTLDILIELEPMNWEHYHLYGNWLKGRGLWPLSLSYYTSALHVSLAPGRGALPALRAAALLLRAAGQRARLLRLMIGWQSRVGGEGAAARRRAAAAAWRLRSELEGRAARYARTPVTTSTCLHHSQLELSPGAYRQNILVKHPRTIPEPIAVEIKSSCQKVDNKKSLSISAQYKPIHNKSDSGIKQKSCPLHKNKKIKDPESLPYVTDHLLKTC